MLDQLEKARRDLLELTTRTRLLSTPRRTTRVKTIEVIDELSDEVFSILVQQGKSMSFIPKPEEEKEEDSVDQGDERELTPHLVQPEEKDDSGGVASGHRDTKLQTMMTSVALQKRLLSIYYDARSYEEEQGVNILYLALGFLKWFEAESSTSPNYAPLILVPMTIERKSAGSKFRIEFSGEELSTNLSLQAKLNIDFGVKLPDLPLPDELAPKEYCRKVQKAIRAYPEWEVLTDNIVLGFFSFAKFLMYRDLDARNWPERGALENHPLLEGLLTPEGFPGDVSPFPPDPDVDEILDPKEMIHVLDADSSQAIAIEEVKDGRNLVIQGPPGTGKSQTITNLIAAAVREGKKVLFVAEKMAALDVVKRRLDDIDLGCMCLELHSHKARKKSVLRDLERTLSLGRPKGPKGTSVIQALRQRRDELNKYAAQIHTPQDPSGFTPYKIAGHLVRLSARGTKPPDFRLPLASSWTREDFEMRRRLCSNLAGHVTHSGVPSSHSWRGIALDAVLPADVERIARKSESLWERMNEWVSCAKALSAHLGSRIDTFQEAEEHLNLCRRIFEAPRMDRHAFGHEIWKNRDTIQAVVQRGKDFEEVREQLRNVFTEEAWEEDWSDVQRVYTVHGSSWLRIFNREYRQARNMLRSFAGHKMPKAVEGQLEILHTIQRAQGLRQEIRDTEELGRTAFGCLWEREHSSWDELEAVVLWEEETASSSVPRDFHAIVTSLQDLEKLEELIRPVKEKLENLISDLEELFAAVKLDFQEAFGESILENVSLEALAARLEKWTGAAEGIQEWVRFRALVARAHDEGLDAIVARVYDGRLSADETLETFEYAFFEILMEEVYKRYPELATFSGESHEKLIEEFCKLDKRRIALARREVARAHYEAIPSGSAEIGELGLVRREIGKQRRHLPLRQLIKRAGRAIQAIKPVFMMSPLSVAQYIEPGAVEFDILFIDEASQVQPVDALGAIARCKQMVVVGDEKQLPPTRFFSRILDEEWKEEDGEFSAGDLESILGLSLAQGVPDRMLRWHYRSRHESLIALSNHHFYDNQLFVVPSAQDPEHLGLKFHKVLGIYDRGGTATNSNEAKAVAEAVLEHARRNPNVTLGVGAFSVSQRDAILDELELLRREHPEYERFFGPSGPEPFFVKNLEAIQGDERDVIFISVGYGPDPSGFISMNFGPLSTEGGERRLNVLITRARDRCEIFSSIDAADIDLNRARGAGVAALKRFLSYAQTGNLDIARPSGGDPDSPFEEEVARALRTHGWEVVHQVGVAGFFIDLAIRNPESPSDYLIGIECDGASYHSARWARDRDRLREKVLKDRGWELHRIWSTDWFKQPEQELRKALGAIEKASVMAANDENRSEDADEKGTEPEEEQRVDRMERKGVGGIETEPQSWVGKPYVEGLISVEANANPHEVPRAKLREVVEQIIDFEGPVHKEEIAKRVTAVWGLKRTGSRIREATHRALEDLVREGKIHKEGHFFSLTSETWVPPRDRQDVESVTLRNPEMLPPVEIRTGLTMAIQQHVGVSEDHLVVEVTRMFGFKRAGGSLQSIIRDQLQKLLEQGEVVERQGRLYHD